MTKPGLKIEIVGSGPAALTESGSLSAVEGLSIASGANPDPSAARQYASRLSNVDAPASVSEAHSDLFRRSCPEALRIPSSDRAAMNRLQEGCQLLLTTRLLTIVQEVVNLVGPAQACERKVSSGQWFRLSPALIRCRDRIASGPVGRLSRVASTLAMIRLGGLLAEVAIDSVEAIARSAAIGPWVGPA